MRYSTQEDMVRTLSYALDNCHLLGLPVSPRLHSDLLSYMLATGY